MLDLDKYINNSIRVKLFGKEYDIMEPSVAMSMEVDRIESEITEENAHSNRLKCAVVLLNHNKQGKRFTSDDLSKLPFEALVRLIAEISLMRLKADQDPNSDSQSRMDQ